MGVSPLQGLGKNWRIPRALLWASAFCPFGASEAEGKGEKEKGREQRGKGREQRREGGEQKEQRGESREGRGKVFPLFYRNYLRGVVWVVYLSDWNCCYYEFYEKICLGWFFCGVDGGGEFSGGGDAGFFEYWGDERV